MSRLLRLAFGAFALLFAFLAVAALGRLMVITCKATTCDINRTWFTVLPLGTADKVPAMQEAIARRMCDAEGENCNVTLTLIGAEAREELTILGSLATAESYAEQINNHLAGGTANTLTLEVGSLAPRLVGSAAIALPLTAFALSIILGPTRPPVDLREEFDNRER